MSGESGDNQQDQEVFTVKDIFAFSFPNKESLNRIPKHQTYTKCAGNNIIFHQTKNFDGKYLAHLEVYPIDKIENKPRHDWWQHANMITTFAIDSDEDEKYKQIEDLTLEVLKQIKCNKLYFFSKFDLNNDWLNCIDCEEKIIQLKSLISAYNFDDNVSYQISSHKDSLKIIPFCPNCKTDFEISVKANIVTIPKGKLYWDMYEKFGQ